MNKLFNLCFIIPFIMHVILTYYSMNHIKNSNTYKKTPLRDILHDNLEDLSDYKYIVDIVALLFFLPLISNKRYDILSNFFKLFSVFTGLRIITSVVTELPKSDKHCSIKLRGYFPYIRGHCFDKIFSGHTTFTLLSILTALKFNLIKKSSFGIMLFLQILYAIFIVLTKCHYTVDVLLAYLIVVPIYLLINDMNIFL